MKIMVTNKQHKDGLNTDRDMVYSSKCETEVFEIQTGTYGVGGGGGAIWLPPPPPPPDSERACVKGMIFSLSVLYSIKS